MKAFATDVLESIKQAKRGEFAQIHTRTDTTQNNFIEHLQDIPKTPDENVDGLAANDLDIQPRSINLGDSLSKKSA